LKIQCVLLTLVLSISAIQIQAQKDTLRLYTYLHSLFDHRPPLNPTPNDETTVPYWLKLLANETGDHYESTGEFGILSQWAGTLPPNSNLGYDVIPPFWDSEFTSFSDANFNSAIIMPLNYQQDLPPRDPYWGETVSPIDFTKTIFNYLRTEEPGIQMYIYEHWPDMAQYISGDFPPTTSEWDSYNAYLNGGFHEWFLEYNDSLKLAFPDECINMIPVGPAISTLLYTAPYNVIPIDSLYEDDAPHGRPTIYFLAALTTYMAMHYFLAALTTYMAMHEVKAPTDYTVPQIIHSTIRENYQEVVNILWAELQEFNDPSEESRVFCKGITVAIDNVAFSGRQLEDYIELQFTTLAGLRNTGYYVERSTNGLDWVSLDFIPALHNSTSVHRHTLIDPSPNLGKNIYRIKELASDGSVNYSKNISVIFKDITPPIFYPNPTTETLFVSSEITGTIQIINQLGVVEKQYDNPDKQINIQGLSEGIYLIRWQRNQKSFSSPIIIGH